MFDSPAMEQDKVKDLSALTYVFIPLSESPTSCLCLHGKVFEQRQKSAILDICRLSLHQAFDFFQVVEDLMRLLHVVFVACFKHASFTLLIMEKAKFDLDVHGILKLFDALLHCAKVACEVILWLFLDEWEYDGQLIEEVVDGVENGMQGQIGIRREEELMLH